MNRLDEVRARILTLEKERNDIRPANYGSPEDRLRTIRLELAALYGEPNASTVAAHQNKG